AIFHGLGLNVMIFDYRGYGASAGRPNEKGTYLDAQAAYDWVVKEKGALPRDIIAYGESLGGSIAAHLAGTNECGGLILDSAFTSLAAVGQRHFPWLPVRWIVGNKYDTTAFLAKVNCPVLVIHSRDDEIVPFDMGEELFRLAREPKKFVEIRGTHNEGFIESEDAYVQELRDWLQESEKRKAINEK
ncbi:MAG TPA: alpha/beta hydrolase, partial [Sedimentisphaerales bacterium]|nr:alpha/beta hydrolase [Sedimentisphaerales bacterium]